MGSFQPAPDFDDRGLVRQQAALSLGLGLRKGRPAHCGFGTRDQGFSWREPVDDDSVQAFGIEVVARAENCCRPGSDSDCVRRDHEGRVFGQAPLGSQQRPVVGSL